VSATEPSLQQEQRDVARARIVRATQRVLAVRGLATTVDDVAEAAGVSRRTVFRHFSTRERLFATAIRAGLQAYADHLPPPPPDSGGAVDAETLDAETLDAWLLDVLLAAHRINARNGRIYWDLSALEHDLTAELAAVDAVRREARRAFAERVTATLWRGRGGPGEPPGWLVDAVAVHLSGFATQSLAGDFGRTPDDVARVSFRVVRAALAAALADAATGPAGA
jgi:AcrR family transcriptional regulator